MSVELAMAAVIVALGMVQIGLGAIVYRVEHGVAYANTARDAPPAKPDSALLGRLTRAENNLLATGPYFIGLALIITVASISSPMTRNAALVFVAARLLYLPLYAFAVPYLRGLVWTISFIALGVMASAALAAVSWSHVLAFG